MIAELPLVKCLLLVHHYTSQKSTFSRSFKNNYFFLYTYLNSWNKPLVCSQGGLWKTQIADEQLQNRVITII